MQHVGVCACVCVMWLTQNIVKVIKNVLSKCAVVKEAVKSPRMLALGRTAVVFMEGTRQKLLHRFI